MEQIQAKHDALKTAGERRIHVVIP